MLLDEVLTGVFSRRAVFINDLKRREEESSLSHPLTPFSAETPERNLGVNFGESLLEPDQLVFQLHNSNICSDTENGFALMRLDALMADEAAKFDTTGPAQSCYCSSEEEDEDEEVRSESSYSVLSSSSAGSHPKLNESWRKRRKEISQTSLERPLVEGEGGRGGDDSISISSLLDGLPIGLPTTQVVSPPPPPPRQFGAADSCAATCVSTSSVPLFADTGDTPSNQRRGSTNSLQFDHGATLKTSEDSTLSGEDLTAKFVDLHGQLSRPITESSLLRTAYERHLNRYTTNADLCSPLRLKHRWRVCRRLRQRQQSSVGFESEEDRQNCNCRIGIAKAPEFLCCATGFSFRSMVDTADGTISENSATDSNGTGESLNEEAGSAPSSFRIADLRPLLYPHSCDGRIIDSSAALVSRSSTTVSVLGPVDIFLTPLCTECLDRYITIMTPVVANRSPSAVIDELHFKCLLSAGRQGKVLYEEKLKHQYPSLSVENVKSPPPSASSPAPNSTKKASFFDQFSENTLWFHRFGSISMDHVVTPVPSNETQSTQAGPRSRPDVPALVNTTEDASSNMTHPPPLSGIHSHHHDRKHHLAEENNLVGLLSLGRVNIGFMQIYAVEDVVTVDSLSLGLNDLTCVSLLTLAVDAVKIQMLNNKRILHVGMESRKLEASSTAPLSNATPFSPEVLTRSLLTAEERRLSEVLEENDEDNSTAASPLLSSSHRSNSNSIRRESQTALTAASNSKPNLTEGDVESGPTIVELKPQPIPKVVSATEVRHTERLVCNFSISRIHSQLRRLTRESSFTPDVLLTAIPFSASRVFFAFDADQSAISRQAGTTRKSPPAVGGLYTGVHGPTPANSTSQLHQPPQPSNIPLCTSESALPGHSAGWIMFESGMEELTLLFVQRKGFGDSLEEKSDNMTTDQPNKRKPKAIDVPSPTLLTEETPKEETYDDAEGIKNAFLMNLHVKTVWLNFPAPKHLPSKRRMELIRSDWNFLSTMTPTVNAWIGPCNRLAGHSKNLITLADRRTLSVLACLMMEAVNGDKLLPDFRFSSLEDEIFNTISTLRTPDSRRLRYDPSCQIFTTLRRYLQVLRKRDGPAALNSKLNDWLRESVLPEKMTLLRGLFLILREWRVAVDVLVLPQVAPAISRKFTTLLSRRKEDSGRKALHTTTTANMALNEPLERRPSGLTLRMFELMTQNTADSRTVNAAGGGRSNGNINAVEEIDENEESDLDDESLINDPRLRKENTILYRFLQDAQHVIRQSESGGNILDTSDDSAVLRGSGPPAASSEPKREFRPKPSAVAENTADSQQQRQRSRSPSLTPENMNQINHLKGQF
ncbi:unnamed protein product, partial [Hymenolepis diminuta]